MTQFIVLDSHRLPGGNFNIEKEMLEQEGIEFIVSECKTEEEIIEQAKKADGIGIIYSEINKNIIDKLENCKVIIRYGIGYDSIDVEAASKKGILVCNLPDYCQPDVATHAMALLLDLCRKVTLLDRSTRKGNWDQNYGYPIHRLSCLTLGLIGFGSVARLFVKYLSGFDMNIIAYDPYLPDSYFSELNVKRVTLEELYSSADAISIHTPLTPDTHHLINADAFSQMKEGVLLINTARGQIVNLNDLLLALKSGKVKAAGLDVVEIEPVYDANAEMYSYENLIVNPHSAFNSVEASYEQHQKVGITAVNVLVKDSVPYNTVNKSQLNDK